MSTVLTPAAAASADASSLPAPPPQGHSSADLCRWLEQVYRTYHRPDLRGSDPIIAMDGVADAHDREIVGLIAALLAYGNVKAIQRGVADALARMECSSGILRPGVRQWLEKRSAAEVRAAFADFRYRVTGPADMASLLIGMCGLIESHGSLNAAFTAHVRSHHETVLPALSGFVHDLCQAAGANLYHLLPSPDRGSACKRLMLYLRWMVRCDAIDPGGWSGVRPSQLIIPLDTHMHRMALELGLTARRQADLRTAIQVTQALGKICPHDPLRYDFALTRPGILRHRR